MKTLHLSIIILGMTLAFLSIMVIANVGIAYAQEGSATGPVSMGPPPVQNSSKRFDIKVEFAQISVAVNPATNMIYVAHTPGSDSISVISGKTNKTVSVI